MKDQLYRQELDRLGLENDTAKADIIQSVSSRRIIPAVTWRKPAIAAGLAVALMAAVLSAALPYGKGAQPPAPVSPDTSAAGTPNTDASPAETGAVTSPTSSALLPTEVTSEVFYAKTYLAAPQSAPEGWTWEYHLVGDGVTDILGYIAARKGDLTVRLLTVECLGMVREPDPEKYADTEWDFNTFVYEVDMYWPPGSDYSGGYTMLIGNEDIREGWAQGALLGWTDGAGNYYARNELRVLKKVDGELQVISCRSEILGPTMFPGADWPNLQEHWEEDFDRQREAYGISKEDCAEMAEQFFAANDIDTIQCMVD